MRPVTDLFPFTSEDAIKALVTNPLVVSSGLPKRTLEAHTALHHDVAGIGVIRIMAGLYTIKADLFKQIPHYSFQCLCHDSLVPPAATDTIANKRFLRIGAVGNDADGANGLTIKLNGPEVKIILYLST